MRKFSYLWNDLPIEERTRLMPYMIKAQINHYEQCKIKAIRSHKKLLADYNSHIKNCKESLLKMEKEAKELEKC